MATCVLPGAAAVTNNLFLAIVEILSVHTADVATKLPRGIWIEVVERTHCCNVYKSWDVCTGADTLLYSRTDSKIDQWLSLRVRKNQGEVCLVRRK